MPVALRRFGFFRVLPICQYCPHILLFTTVLLNLKNRQCLVASPYWISGLAFMEGSGSDAEDLAAERGMTKPFQVLIPPALNTFV